MVNVVLVVKDKEPQVISLENGSIEEYKKVLSEALSEKERSLSDIDFIESFRLDIEYVSGFVEECSALHPYERNRHWYGPALFYQYDDGGNIVSMSDENISKVAELFSLKNKLASPSEYINDFIDKYAKSIMHPISIGSNHAILDTMDAADFLKKAKNPEDVAFVENALREIEQIAEKEDTPIEELFTKYLKEVNHFLFSQRIQESPLFDYM